MVQVVQKVRRQHQGFVIAAVELQQVQNDGYRWGVGGGKLELLIRQFLLLPEASYLEGACVTSADC